MKRKRRSGIIQSAFAFCSFVFPVVEIHYIETVREVNRIKFALTPKKIRFREILLTSPLLADNNSHIYHCDYTYFHCKKEETIMNTQIYQSLNPQIIRCRRELHQIPETGTCLPQTSDYIKKRLSEFGVPFTPNQGDSGLIAFLDTKKPGRTIAFRADMDALPIKEETGLSYASSNGNMHACGHDSHMAILLSTIFYIKEHLSDFQGRFLFLFQTGEEISKGALIMKKEPFFLEHQPDVIFGLHIGLLHPEVSTGQLGISPELLMASYDKFHITVTGKGCHGSTPDSGINPISAGAVIVSSLHTILSQELPSSAQACLAVCQIHGGSTYNCIPSICEIEGTIRALSPDMRSFLWKRLTEIAELSAKSLRADAHVSIEAGAPALMNNPHAAALLKETAETLFPKEDIVFPLSPIMVGEDFSEYLTDIPGAFFFLGAGNKEKNCIYPHHHPKFQIDEEVLWRGCALFLETAKHMT